LAAGRLPSLSQVEALGAIVEKAEQTLVVVLGNGNEHTLKLHEPEARNLELAAENLSYSFPPFNRTWLETATGVLIRHDAIAEIHIRTQSVDSSIAVH
jgi:hypothetical protein